jgi:hypothetical protein
MIKKLSQMTSNIMKSFHNGIDRKGITDRLLSMKEEIESIEQSLQDAMGGKDKLSKLNEEYLYCLNQADPSIFRRKHPKFF